MKRIRRPLPLTDVSTTMRRWRRALRCALAAAAIAGAWPANAQTVFVLTTDGKLATTTVTNPGLVSTALTITGVNANDTLVAIDVRPQNQNLYALGVNAVADTVQLYLLSPVTGFAVPIGSAAGFVGSGGSAVDFPTTGWDIDFNPAVDRLRVVTSSGLSFRMNPNTGGLVDGDLGGAAGSVAGVNTDGAINGATTTVQGAAYTNNRPNNGGITTLYTLDATTNALFIQNPPNAGTQTAGLTVTILNVAVLDFTAVSGFDIAPGVNVASSNAAVTAGVGIAVLKTATGSLLYTLDLATGVAVPRGNLDVRSLALVPDIGASAATSVLRSCARLVVGRRSSLVNGDRSSNRPCSSATFFSAETLIPSRLRAGQKITGCLPCNKIERHSFSIGEWKPLMTVTPASRKAWASS